MSLRLLLAALACLLGACSQSVDNREPPAALGAFPEQARAHQVWTQDLGAAAGAIDVTLQPHLDGETLYAAGTGGQVMALSANTGKRLWQINLDQPLSAGVGGFGERLFVATPKGLVLALAADSGERLWQAQMPSEVLAAPVAADDKVVVRSIDGRVWALAADSGERLWSFARDVPTLSLRGQSRPVIAGGAVFIGLDNGRLAVLDFATGALYWERVIAAPSGRSEVERLVDIDAGPLLLDQALYVAAYQGRVARLAVRDGSTLWARDLSSRRPLQSDGKQLLVTDAESEVLALALDNGATLWRQDQLRMRRLSAPALHGAYIAVGDFEGYVHWLAPDTGQFRARRRVGDSAISATPLTHNDLLYVQTRSGKLSALRIQPITR